MILHALILAGGPGTRLWPMSRQHRPKQVQKLLAGKSMLELTLERFKTFSPDTHIYVAIGKEEEPLVREVVRPWPDANLIVEPCVRSTGPAIAWATAKLQHVNPEGVLGVFPSDHDFGAPRQFFSLLEMAQRLASNTNGLVLFGARPTYPASKYGYIRMGKPVQLISGLNAFEIDAFIEKPTKEQAVELISNEGCLWNMGIFLGALSSFEQAYKWHAPETWDRIEVIQQALGTSDEEEVFKKEYSALETISIDYAVIEKCENLVVIPCEADWTDMGDWAAIHSVLPKSPEGNVLVGNVHAIDTANSYLHGFDKPIIAVGLSDIIIVDSGDALLIVSKGKAQKVSEVRKYLQDNGMDSLL